MEKFVELRYHGLKLFGVLHFSKNNSHTYAVIVPGVPGDRVDARRINVKIARALAERRINCLRVDFLASGISEGEYYNVSYQGICEQLTLIAHQIAVEDSKSDIVLIAFSEAGKVALQALSMIHSVTKVVLCNGILEGHERAEYLNLKRAWKKDGCVVTDLGYGVWINTDLLKERCKYSLPELSQSGKIVGIYGTNDVLTAPSRIALIEAGIKVIDIPGADHLFTKRAWEEHLIKHVVDNIDVGEKDDTTVAASE